MEIIKEQPKEVHRCVITDKQTSTAIPVIVPATIARLVYLSFWPNLQSPSVVSPQKASAPTNTSGFRIHLFNPRWPGSCPVSRRRSRYPHAAIIPPEIIDAAPKTISRYVPWMFSFLAWMLFAQQFPPFSKIEGSTHSFSWGWRHSIVLALLSFPPIAVVLHSCSDSTVGRILTKRRMSLQGVDVGSKINFQIVEIWALSALRGKKYTGIYGSSFPKWW